jgi:hypothetical protein
MRMRNPVQNGSITGSSNALRDRSGARAIASAIGYPASRHTSVETPATFTLSSSACR